MLADDHSIVIEGLRRVLEPTYTVEAGDTLVILESMKMEIPVVSEDGGRVSKLAVGEGDVVQEGDLIALVD